MAQIYCGVPLVQSGFLVPLRHLLQPSVESQATPFGQRRQSGMTQGTEYICCAIL